MRFVLFIGVQSHPIARRGGLKDHEIIGIEEAPIQTRYICVTRQEEKTLAIKGAMCSSSGSPHRVSEGKGVYLINPPDQKHVICEFHYRSKLTLEQIIEKIERNKYITSGKLTDFKTKEVLLVIPRKTT